MLFDNTTLALLSLREAIQYWVANSIFSRLDFMEEDKTINCRAGRMSPSVVFVSIFSLSYIDNKVYHVQ